MKKIFFLLIFLTSACLLHAQSDSRFLTRQGIINDSIRVPTGTDTTVYVEFFCPGMWGVQFDYRDFDASDATLDIGTCPLNDGNTFDRLDDSSLPITLSDSTVSIEKYTFNFRYMAIKLTKNSVTAGLYMPYYITFEKTDRR